jgi:predicted ATPase/DNA-binding SARP family transcriptional activator/TolA-binding protein
MAGAEAEAAGGPGPAAGLRLEVLGGLSLTLDGAPLPGLAYAKGRALLAYLAVTGRPHAREALAALLWGELPDGSARQNLRVVLADLRRAAGDHLVVTRTTVAFDRAAPYWLDAAAFEAALRPPDSGGAVPPERLRAAAALYRGDLLEGFAVREAPAFDEWLAAERERLRQLALHALHALAVHHTERGEAAAGIDYTTRLLALDPWREDAHRQLMLLLAANGERDAALAQYERCRQALAEELGVVPAAETTALYERIRTGEVGARRPPGPPSPAPLPVPPTPLLGRAAELAAIARLLGRPAVRLVTVLGPPGVGKTRLALEAAAHRQGDYAGGVWFVDLAPMHDPALVVPAIAQALGVREGGARPLLDDLAAALRGQHVLLVLDNCEQVLGAAPALAALLARCPRLSLLATSRAPLRLRGEHEVALDPLALPELGRLPDQPGTSDLAALTQSPAVALFVERAAAVHAAFELAPPTARAVAELCVRLDGLPLAIELAAARLRVLPLPALVERLTHRLRLLTGGPRDLPARQQTLRATLDWSYGLLAEPEQAVFRRLGVFAGGFTLAAAETVCTFGADAGGTAEDGSGSSAEAGNRPPAFVLGQGEVLAELEGLVGQSLVRREPGAGEAPRYTMLFTIREYALEALRACGEAEAAARSHARYFLGLGERADDALRGPGQLGWLARLEAEHANLRAALAWYVEQRAAAWGLRLAAALGRFWTMRGYLSEGRAGVAAALAIEGGPRAAALRARACYWAGKLAWVQTDYGAARTHFEAGLRLGREAGDRRSVAYALHGLGETCELEGDPAEALALYRESEALFRAVGDRWGLARLLDRLGLSLARFGDAAAGRRYWQEAAALMNELGDGEGIARGLHRAADDALRRGDLDEARSLAERALAMQRELGTGEDFAWSLYQLGLIAMEQGDTVEARERLEQSLAMWEQAGSPGNAAVLARWLGRVLQELGDRAGARQRFEQCRAWGGAAGNPEVTAEALAHLADLALEEDDLEGARAFLRQAAPLLGGRVWLRRIRAWSLLRCAYLAAAEGQAARALRLAAAAVTQAGDSADALTAHERGAMERRLVPARQALGAAAQGTAWAEGEALTWEQALAEAAALLDGGTEWAGYEGRTYPPLSVPKT